MCVVYVVARHSHQEYLDQIPAGSQSLDIAKWCEDPTSPMFRFYYFLLKLKILVLQFVRSVRTGNRLLCIEPFELCSLDSCAYSGYAYITRNTSWRPQSFRRGSIYGQQNWESVFNIGLDHGQEQNTKDFKHQGRPLSFTHSPHQLLLYLISCPEVTSHIAFFQDLFSSVHNDGLCHHEQTNAYQNMYINHTKLLYGKYQEYGNVFSDNTNTLYDLATGITRPPSTIDSIISLESLGRNQCESYVQTRLAERSISIDYLYWLSLLSQRLGQISLNLRNCPKSKQFREPGSKSFKKCSSYSLSALCR